MYAVRLGRMVMVRKQETTARAPHQDCTFISATAGRQLSHALILRAAAFRASKLLRRVSRASGSFHETFHKSCREQYHLGTGQRLYCSAALTK